MTGSPALRRTAQRVGLLLPHAPRKLKRVHPYLLHHGHFILPTFGALAALGLVAALVLSERTARWRGLPAERLWNAGIFTVVAAFVSSRLVLAAGHFDTFLHYPMLLLAVPSLTPIGMAITALATLAWLHYRHLPLAATLDAWAPCATLLWAFLALGHFAEGSDLGMPSAHSVMGIRPPGITVPLYPIALYAAAFALGLTALLYRRLRRHRANVAAEALAATGLFQFLLSFLRQPAEYPVLTLDPIQGISLAMLAAAASLFILRRNAA